MILNNYLLVLLFIAFRENHCMCFLLCIDPSFRLYYTLPPCLLSSLLWSCCSHIPKSPVLGLVCEHISHRNPHFSTLLQLRVGFTCTILPAFQFQWMPLGIEQPVVHMERLNSSYSRISTVNPERVCCWGRFFASKPRPPLSTSLSVYLSPWFLLDPFLSWSA